MKKYIVGLVLALCAVGAIGAPVMAESRIEPRTVEAGENSEVQVTSEEVEIEPTFSIEEEQKSGTATLRFGHNIILLGNNINSSKRNSAGMLFAFGNNLAVGTKSDYGFAAANTINYAGETEKDLYIAGNSITLMSDAKIGRDVFAAGNTLIVESDLAGDLSFAGESVIVKDAVIAGNVNLDVSTVRFEGKVEIGGVLTYNDTAEVSGLGNVKVTETSIYEDVTVVEETFASAVTDQVFSVVSLALVMLLVCALFPRLHSKVEQESTTSRFGVDLAIGLGVLIGMPIAAIFLLCTIIGAPLGILLIGVYIIMIYLSQGFAGAWLGHIIVEKLCKMKGNIFVETIVGIIILGALALVPWIGEVTGFLGLLLGLGLILTGIRPVKQSDAKVEPKTAKSVGAKASAKNAKATSAKAKAGAKTKKAK